MKYNFLRKTSVVTECLSEIFYCRARCENGADVSCGHVCPEGDYLILKQFL